MLDRSGWQDNRDSGLTIPPGLPAPVEEFYLKRKTAEMRTDDRRRFVRRDVVHTAKAHLSTTLPAFVRPNEETTVYLYDVSRQGIGFLCGRNVFPEERIRLEVSGAQPTQVLVKRCVRVAAGWFQVGGVFVTANT